MMKRIAVLLILGLFCMTMLAASANAGPWTLNKGRAWYEAYVRYSHANEAFDPDGNRSKWENGGWSSIYDVELKAEYGATDDLNLLLGVPYTWSTWKDGNGTLENEGFKEINFGAKYRIVRKPVTAAVQLKFFLQPRGLDTTKPPELSTYGDGIEIRGIVGKSWNVLGGKQLYVSCESGYKWSAKWTARTKYANFIPVFAEVGFAPFSWLMLKGEIDCMISHPHTGQIKDTYIWRAGPIFNLIGKGFSSVTKGEDEPDEEISLNVELQYGQVFAGRGDPNIQRDPSWPNSDDRINASQEYVAKVQLLF